MGCGMREAMCAKWGIPVDSTWGDISKVQREDARIKTCQRQGLPETSSWQELADALTELRRIDNCKARSIPLSSTWKDINAHDSAHTQRIISEYSHE